MGTRAGESSAEAEEMVVGFRWFVEVCNAYEDLEADSADEVGFGSAADVFAIYQVSRRDACGFAIYGYETQGELNFEDTLARAASQYEKMKALAMFYKDQLISQYEAIQRAVKKIEAQLLEGQ